MNPHPKQPTDYRLTPNFHKLNALLLNGRMTGPNFYKRERARLAGFVQSVVESSGVTTPGFRFTLHEATDYGGMLSFSDPHVAGIHWLTKGKLRWSDLEFYGFSNPQPITHEPATTTLASSSPL
jgi:hypothetical protein